MPYEIICLQKETVGSHSWFQFKNLAAALLWAYGKSVHHSVTVKNKTDHSLNLGTNVREAAVTRVSQSPLGRGPNDITKVHFPPP